MALTIPTSSSPSADAAPLGHYWKLPEAEQVAYRREVGRALQLPRFPTERQMLFLLATFGRSLRQPIFFGGAMGGAKTSGVAMLAIHLCRAIEKNRVLMCRREFSTFRGSTLVELEEQLEDCSDAKHWPGKHEVHFANGSEIWYMGVGRPEQREKLGSYQFGAVLIDEAPEVDHDVVRMLQTRLRWKPAARANRTVMALTGNPYPGWIKQDFVTQPKAGYSFIPARAWDNPHLPAGYIEDMRAEMPPEWYRAFIEGDWDALVPTTAAIPVKLVEGARRRKEPMNLGDCVWGIDVGHLGTDSTWIARRQGYHFDFIDGWQQKRTDESVDLILHHLSYATPYPRRIVVDYDGIGAGVGDGLLKAQEAGSIPQTCEIVGLHAQKTATVEAAGVFAPVRYANMKSQLAFELRKILESKRGQLPDDEDMAQDLTAPNYDVIDGRVYIESKKLVRRKLGRSPDKGDALLLTVYAGSADEIAGLPINAEALITQYADAEELELVTMQQQKAKLTWYANPFARLGVRTRLTSGDVDSDVGY